MTNDTTPATDEYEWKKHPANDQQMLQYLNFYCEPTLSRFKGDRLREIREVFARWYADRARISALQSEITALRGLCGEAMEMIDHLDDQVGAVCDFCNYQTNGNRHTADCKKRTLVNQLYRASKGEL